MSKDRGFTIKRNAKANNLGFSLIELLVTISIIAILSAIGMVIYSSVLKQGRDTKRQSDLRSIQSALEQYYSDQLYYPQTATINALIRNSGALKNATGTKTYLNSVPHDPTGESEYSYLALPVSTPECDNTAGNECTSYCLAVHLENTNTSLISSGCSGSFPPSYNFSVSPP